MIYTCPNCHHELVAKSRDAIACPKCQAGGIQCLMVPLRTPIDAAHDIKVIHEDPNRHLCELMLALDENVEDLPPPVQEAFCRLASDLGHSDELVSLVGSLTHTVLQRICDGYTPPGPSDEG